MVLEYARSETRYGGERVSAERNQVSRDRGFSGKQFTSLWCTAISEFHVGRRIR